MDNGDVVEVGGWLVQLGGVNLKVSGLFEIEIRREELEIVEGARRNYLPLALELLQIHVRWFELLKCEVIIQQEFCTKTMWARRVSDREGSIFQELTSTWNAGISR